MLWIRAAFLEARSVASLRGSVMLRIASFVPTNRAPIHIHTEAGMTFLALGSSRIASDNSSCAALGFKAPGK